MCNSGTSNPSSPSSGSDATATCGESTPTCPHVVQVHIRDRVGIGDPCRLIHRGKTRRYSAIGTPTGGTYSWSVSGNVSIASGGSTQNVQISGDTTSAGMEDCSLTVSYTESGRTAQEEIRLTVYELQRISVTVRATPALTARATTPAPANHTFNINKTTETFPRNETLILIRGTAQTVRLEAQVTPADTPLAWDVKRAPDDVAALGTGTPTVTRDAANSRIAELQTNETGSFYVRVFDDCLGDGTFDAEKGFLLQPLVLAQVTSITDNSVTHTGHIAPSVAGGSFGLRTGSFNIASPNTEAIHMNATVDIRTGGADGRRHLDCVFAGWINNERANENIIGSYAGGHTRFSVFASNRTSATGAGRTFLPTNPAPVLVAPPLLDSGQRSPGTGGDTAALTRSRIRSRTAQAIGERWIVESIDSPGDSAPLQHPAPHHTRLQRFHFELLFSAFLSFWTNRTRSAGATGDPADRVYLCARSYHWDMLGEWTIGPAPGNAITQVTAMSVTMSSQQTRNPLNENHNVNCEVRPPTGLSLLANDGRT